VLELDGRQVQLQSWLCSANHRIRYYDIYHKNYENTDKIKINMLQSLSLLESRKFYFLRLYNVV